MCHSTLVCHKWATSVLQEFGRGSLLVGPLGEVSLSPAAQCALPAVQKPVVCLEKFCGFSVSHMMQKVENHCSEPRWGSSLFSGSNAVGKDPSVHCTGLKLFSGYPLAGIKNSEARGGQNELQGQDGADRWCSHHVLGQSLQCGGFLQEMNLGFWPPSAELCTVRCNSLQ